MQQIGFFVRIAVCTVFIFLPLQSMDQWFYDRFFRLKGVGLVRPTPVVLVRINDAKLYQYLATEKNSRPELEYPIEHSAHSIWYREFYETLLDRIEADKPKLVVFTSFYEWVERGKLTGPTYPNLVFSALVNEEFKLIPPPTSLLNGQNYGYNNIFPDSDNVVRQSKLIYSSGISLALKVHQVLEAHAPDRDLLEPIWIDYRGPSGSYPNYDAWELFEESPFKPGRFAGKIVLIGREGSPASDLETPFGKMSRTEIQANILETFLDHRDIKILPRIVTRVAAALAVIASVIIILRFSLTMAWVLLLGLAGVIFVITLVLLTEFKIWIGIANPIFCIFSTHLLMLGHKLGKQQEQQWKLEQEREYLKELDQFKNNFISLFSHDLKTPIAKIKAVTDRLLVGKKVESAEVQEGLHTIDRTNAELARSISDILKVTKMESMSLELHSGVIDLNRLVEEAVRRLKFLADEKNIRLVQDLEPLFSMEGDQQLITEVITNLMENAIKYSPPDKKVIITTREHESYVRVSITDEGMGIPADELPRITGKFYRGKKVPSDIKGSGLGLYLSKYFVELHHGSLEIKSEYGKGTEVSFTLPITK